MVSHVWRFRSFRIRRWDPATRQLNGSVAEFLKLGRTLVPSFARLEGSKKFLQRLEFFFFTVYKNGNRNGCCRFLHTRATWHECVQYASKLSNYPAALYESLQFYCAQNYITVTDFQGNLTTALFWVVMRRVVRPHDKNVYSMLQNLVITQLLCMNLYSFIVFKLYYRNRFRRKSDNCTLLGCYASSRP